MEQSSQSSRQMKIRKENTWYGTLKARKSLPKKKKKKVVQSFCKR
jgi:hypothetical protein